MNKFFKAFREFFQSGSVGGVILLGCVIVSLFIANSPLGPAFERFLNLELGINTEHIHLKYPVILWINDGLMALFFLMVGLEIKRELVNGQLSSPKRAALPILAAFGGVIVPATIYSLFNYQEPTAVGWGIPMATDIAFALAIINMLGKRVPISLKIFLAALAIVDDLIAILVIAVFYNSDLEYSNLLLAGSILAILFVFNRMGIRQLYFYLVPGLLIWYLVHHSGIHATIAGVLVALTIPTKTIGTEHSPLIRLEHFLARPVNFLIMPLFALVNTNIQIEQEMFAGLFTPLGLGIIFGLMIGKPIGISLTCWLAVKLGISELPQKADLLQIIGVGMLAGIGFTMSIFIAILSFTGMEHVLAEAKLSILIASLSSGILGSVFLILLSNRQKKRQIIN